MRSRPRLLLVLAFLPIAAVGQVPNTVLYRGPEFLNAHRWQDAVDVFSQPAPTGVEREKLLYWKAFALAQLGRKQEALSALAQIPTTNHWYPEARALEEALRGEFRPEVESAEIYQSFNEARKDPERTLELARKILAEPHTTGIKSTALSLVQRLDSPASRDLLKQIVGGGNPDLQVSALSSLVRADPQALVEMYPGIADESLRRMIFAVLGTQKDKQRIVQLARLEKAEQVRLAAYSVLVMQAGGATEALGLLATEPSDRLRRNVGLMIDSQRRFSDTALSDLRSPDPKLRQRGAGTLARSSEANAGIALQAAYANETDPDVKNSIVSALVQLREFDKVHSLAAAEKDIGVKRSILQRLIMDDEGIKTIR